MLYDNDEYDKAIQDFGSKSGYFAILMWMPMLFNKGVQFVLKLVYKIVNVNYMGLSREMEFHADAIAAHVVGSKPMISSMLRMDIASQSFDTTLNFYSEKFIGMKPKIMVKTITLTFLTIWTLFYSFKSSSLFKIFLMILRLLIQIYNPNFLEN